MSSRTRAQAALTMRLRDLLPAETVAQFVGGTHTLEFEHNLLPGLSPLQIRTLRAQLEAGAGGELRPTRTGKRPAHAPYSSATLALNAFGRWLGSEQDLRIDGLRGFSKPLEVESAQQIPHGGGLAHLDCLLRGEGLTVGVESKLTETIGPHRPTPWRLPYHAAELTGLLDGGWREVFAASRSGEWRPAHLGLEQLVKHALALVSRFAGDRLHLVYLWWEPENAEQFPELLAHRAEVAELIERVGEARPRLHAVSYAQLLAEWELLQDPPWIGEHVGQLRARYAVAI